MCYVMAIVHISNRNFSNRMQQFKKLTFSAIIPELVTRFAHNDAVGFVDEKQMTYADMGKKISAVIAFLESLEVEPGEKVMIYSQNMPHWPVVYFAVQCMGAIVVPVLPDFNKHELENIIQHSETKTLFVSESLRYKMEDINTEDIKHIVRINDFTLLQSPSSASFNEDAIPKKEYKTEEDKLSILLYTSGTTGNSKGVMLSQRNVIINAIQGGKVQTIMPKGRFLSVLPLSHTYENTLGLILPILYGASVTYLKRPPTAAVLLPALKSVKPHYMLTVPMLIEKVYRNSIRPGINKSAITRMMYNNRLTNKLICRMAGKKLYKTFGGKLKFFGIGGAKLNAGVEDFLRKAKFPYAIGYGLTESSPLIAGSNPTNTRFQAIGKEVVGGLMKIHNPDPVTGEGEVWAKGPHIMLGYYKDEERTKEVLTHDRWLKTGDLGVIDEKGYLSHKGRMKNMIVGANGENIYPENIESIINTFPHVAESLVMEKKGKLVALVHFNREELELKLKAMAADLSKKVDDRIDELSQRVDRTIEELSNELEQYINSRVNKYSRINDLIVHHEPFVKTATQKIKRYLYV